MLDRRQPYKNLAVLQEKMFSCAFYMKSTVKLPKTTRMVVKIPMDAKTEAVYKELAKEGALEMGEGFMTVNNVLAMTMRKQQVTSGYIPLEYDDGSKELKRISTYRRTFLYKFLKGIPEEEPVVIFAKFRKDLYSIRKVAERLGCGYSEVSGAEDTLAEWMAKHESLVFNTVPALRVLTSPDLTSVFSTVWIIPWASMIKHASVFTDQDKKALACTTILLPL